MSLKFVICFFVLLIIALIIGIHFLCKCHECGNDTGFMLCLVINVILIFIITINSAVIFMIYFYNADKEYNANKKANYENALESDYNIFVNGSLIDGTKIDIKYYEMTINEDTEEVYLTPKN